MVKSLLPVKYEVVNKLFHGVGLTVSATTSNASIENDNSAPVGVQKETCRSLYSLQAATEAMT
jgi:hypothetical protein